MTTSDWELEIAGETHRLQLRHKRLSGRWEVRVDGELRLRERRLGGRGWRRAVEVTGEPVDLAGVPAGRGGYAYYALVRGEPVPTESQQAAGITPAALRREPGMGQRDYWDQLARETGLEYTARADGPFWFRHRLIGRLQGRLIGVGLEQPFGSKVYLSLKAHVPPQKSWTGLKDKLLQDDRMEKLLGSRHNMGARVGVAPTHVGVFLPYEPAHESPADLSGRVKAFARLVAAYAPPLPPDWCAECQKTTDVSWGFMNTFPVQMCHACIEERLAWGQMLQEEARAITPRTIAGLLAGLLVGAWGGLLWGIVTASFPAQSIWPLLLTLIGPLSLALSVRLTYTIARQPVDWFWLVDTSSVLVGLVLVDILATTALETWVARGFVEDGLRNLPLYSLFAAVFTVYYGWRGWRQQRRHLAAMLVPAIEQLPFGPAAAS